MKRESVYHDLTPLFQKKFAPYPRKLGRYSVSDVWAILNGYKTPEEFWNQPPPDLEGILRMWKGMIIHAQVQGVLEEARCEVKKEMQHKHLTIVGKADYLPDDIGWEIKTSEKMFSKSKPWHEWQSKLYCTLFDRPEWAILQPVIKDDRIMLKEVGRVKRDDEWVKARLTELELFHAEVVIIAGDQPVDKPLTPAEQILGL